MPKPAIFIPGFPASELRDKNTNAIVFPPSPGTLLDAARKQTFLNRMINIPGDLVAGPPIATILGIAKEAQSLYDVLHRIGYTIPGPDFTPVGWDWRLGVDAAVTMEAIANAIRNFAPRKVIPILHSTGTLVFREFLKAHPELIPNIEEVLAFGGVWCGTLESLHAVHVGESTSFLGVTLLTADESANLVGHAQAAYDLFPPDPLRTPMNDIQLVHGLNGQQAGANVDTSWIKADRVAYSKPLADNANARLGARSQDFGPVKMTNVVGWGGPTWPSAILTNQDVVFLAKEKDAGDATAPRVSASWIRGANTRTITVPIGSFVTDLIPDFHAHLWDSVAVQQVFREVLQDHKREALIAACSDAKEAIDINSQAVTIRMTAQDADGKPLPNCIATAKVNGANIPVPFKGDVRAVLRLSRAGIHHNAGPDFFQFFVDFKWDGGRRDNIAVSFRAP